VERFALMCTSPGGAYASFPLQTFADLPVDEASERTAELLDTRFTPEYLDAHENGRAFVGMIASLFARPPPVATTASRRW
jgi:hypothetical protein